MTPDEEKPSKYNIQFHGDLNQSQVVVGDYNTVSQKVGLSPQETAELRAVFDQLRSTVAERVPPEKREAALAEAAEMEVAIVSDRPEPTRVRKALTWFRNNAPELAGAVLGVVVNPLVGKVVEAAGQVIAGQFRELAAGPGEDDSVDPHS